MVMLAFALGACAALAILWLRPWIDCVADHVPPAGHAVADAFLLTALPEELVKLLVVLPILLHHETDEPMDGVVYGAATALGFAAVENTLYLQMTGAVCMALERGFTATLLHVGCTGCMGFCIATAKFVRRRRRWLLTAAGPFLAVGLHGAYDLLMLGCEGLGLVALLVVLPVLLGILSVKVRWAQRPLTPRTWRVRWRA